MVMDHTVVSGVEYGLVYVKIAISRHIHIYVLSSVKAVFSRKAIIIVIIIIKKDHLSVYFTPVKVAEKW